MRNGYYALRHGISLANERGIVISRPENGVTGWGLSDRGAAECRRLLGRDRMKAHGFSTQNTVVYTSDFKRASETAEIFCALNDLAPPIVDARLRERGFGRLEKQSIALYDAVWARDLDDADHHFEDCESTKRLAARLRAFLDDRESQWDRKKIVLVSHGDPLQVLQTILHGLRCNQHRSLSHLGNAELRRIDAG